MPPTQISEPEIPAALPAPEPHKALPEPENQEGGSLRKWMVALVLLMLVGAAVWKIRSNSQQQAKEANKMAAAEDRPVPVQVALVERRTMPIYLSALGTVTAYNTVTIKSRVDGQLMQVNVREGQAVHKGDLLMQIDPRPYAAAMAQAQGQLVKDQANAANAEAEAKRYTALLQAGVVSKETQQLQESTAGQAQGALDADRAAIQAARVNLDYTRITSPIDGVVGLRQVDPGNIVHAADTTGLLVVTQLQPITVIFTLPEDQLPEVLTRIRQNKQLVVEAYDRSNTVHLATGALLTVDNQIDPTTGTDKLKAVFNNRDGALFPNQFVNVRLVLQDRVNATVLPAAAVQNGIQGNYVYVVKQGNPPQQQTAGQSVPASRPAADHGNQKSSYYAVSQAVQPSLTEGSLMIVDAGVEPGDQVVVDGQEKLKNGSRVIPRLGNPTASSGAAAGASAPAVAPVPAQPPNGRNTADPNGRHQQSLDERLQGKGKRP